MLYKEMTAFERQAKFLALREAVEIAILGFVNRPVRGRGTSADRAAERDLQKNKREAAFILRIARSLGDGWAGEYAGG